MYGHNDGMTDMEREMRIAVNEAAINRLTQKRTNADRIRASIEDNKKLAELTIERKSVFRRTKGYTETVYVCSDGSVTDDWSIAFNHEMEWLQQPAEDDHE